MSGNISRAAVVILARNEKVLITQRASNAAWAPNTWHFPGGSVEDGEPVIEAAIREMREELGITVTQADLSFQGMAVYDRTSGSDIDTFYFFASNWQGEPQIMEPHKCQATRWCASNELPENMVEHSKVVLADLSRPTFVYVVDGQVQYSL